MHLFQVTRIIRLLAEDTLEQIVDMETENTPLTEHLRATYKRIPYSAL